ncbi:MAG: TIM barrel protein [Anaerolineae bacterium]
MELQEFSDPNVLDGDWRGLLDRYRRALKDFPGLLSMHGAYIDLVSGSPDLRLVALTRERYLHNLEIGRELGVKYIDFHANYLPLVDHPSYLPGWVELAGGLWSLLAEQAAQSGIVLLLENMWEPGSRYHRAHPRTCPIAVFAGLPRRGTCGVVFTSADQRVRIRELGGDLVYTHLHNNHGTTDEHLAFGDGVIDFPELLTLMRALPQPPLFSQTTQPHTDQRQSALFETDTLNLPIRKRDPLSGRVFVEITFSLSFTG